MATWEDVRRIALSLPESVEVGDFGGMHSLSWKVKDKAFVWERPLRASDLKALAALGVEPPPGPILAARVADVGEKDALIAADPDAFFTIPHFTGYPAVLIRLPEIAVDELREVITDAWLARAPAKLAAQYLAR